MEIKSKLYLGTMLLINYMIEENLFMRTGLLQDIQLHGFLSEKISQKKIKERVTRAWPDISDPGHVSFLSKSSI